MKHRTGQDLGIAPQDVAVHEGPPFVLPPRDRLFCAFDDPLWASEALAECVRAGVASMDDVWFFHGREGAANLDPVRARHRLTSVLGRFVQRLLTGDAAYGKDLVAELERGGTVIALHVSRDDVARLTPLLVRHGGHSIAFGTHWNFVAPDEQPRAPEHRAERRARTYRDG